MRPIEGEVFSICIKGEEGETGEDWRREWKEWRRGWNRGAERGRDRLSVDRMGNIGRGFGVVFNYYIRGSVFSISNVLLLVIKFYFWLIWALN